MADDKSNATGGSKLGALPTPLIHEVNALLEKERTLMELRLLEKEVQAAKWKGKYDHLKETIIEGKVNDPDDAAKLEQLAEVDEEQDNDPIEHIGPVQSKSLSALLFTHIEGNLARFNDVPLSKQMFSGILKAVLGSKAQYPGVDTLWFRNCGLSSTLVEAIEYLIRFPKLQGLDISRNDLNEDVLFSFVELLNAKKKTPQYLLADGIAEWANSNRAFMELLTTLSKDTWGLSISLADTVPSPRDLIQKSINVGKKKGETEDEFLYKDFKQPYRAARFIQALRLRIEESNKVGDDLALDGPDKKATPLSKFSKKRPANVAMIGRFSKIVPRLADNLKELSVLGFTEYPLSPFAMKELELLLHTVQHTLTDLNLSFAYVGVAGAAMLETYLKETGCQLVALRLKGNLLGNPGFTRIGSTLKTNKTLTYLDVSNNCIDWMGLSAVREHLLTTKTLMHLDLTHNDILPSDAHQLDEDLQDLSSGLFVRWHDASIPHVMWRIPTSCPVMYDRAIKTSKLCTLGRRVLLARFNLTDLYFHYPHEQHRPLVLRWNMRPAPYRSYEDVQRDIVLRERPVDLQNIDEEPYAMLNLFTCVGWEVSVSHNRHEYFHSFDDVSEEFNTRDLFNEGQPWLANSIVIKDPPSKGTVELYGYLRLKRDRDARGRPIRFHPSRQGMYIEWKDVVVHPLQLTSAQGGWFHLGGDPVDQSPLAVQDTLLQQYCHYQSFPLLKEHFLLRGLSWKFAMPIVKIVFEAKLCVVPQNKRSTDGGDGDKSVVDAIFDSDDNDGDGDGDDEDSLEEKGLYEDSDGNDSDEDGGGHGRPKASSRSDPDRVAVDRYGRPRQAAGMLFDYDCCLSVHRRHEELSLIRQFRCSVEVARQRRREAQQRQRQRRQRRQQSQQRAAAAAAAENDGVPASSSAWPTDPTLAQLEAGECDGVDGDAKTRVDWWNVHYQGVANVVGTTTDDVEGDVDDDRDLYGSSDELDADNGDTASVDGADNVEDDNVFDEAPNPLLAWKWQRFVVYATDLCRTDTLFLTGAPRLHTNPSHSHPRHSPDDGATKEPVSQSSSSSSAAAHVASLTPRQRKLLAQIGVAARKVQVYSYLGDARRYDRHAFADATPMLFRPESVYDPLHAYDTVEREEELFRQRDPWRHMFEAYGIDVDKFHQTHLADVLQRPNVTIPEDEMLAFQQRAQATSDSCKQAIQQWTKAVEEDDV